MMKYSFLALVVVTFLSCAESAPKIDESKPKNEQPNIAANQVDTTHSETTLPAATKGGSKGVQKINEASFKDKVLNADGLTLVDFSATWCGPCRAMEPALHAVAKQMEGKMNFAQVDVDESPNLAAGLKISSIPFLAFYRNGKLIDKVIGQQSEEDLKKKIEELL